MDRHELYRKIREMWMDPKQQLPASKQHREEIVALSQTLRVSYAELEKVLVEFWKRGPAPTLPPISTTTTGGRSTLSPSPSFFHPLSPQPMTERARRLARPSTPTRSPTPTPTTASTSRRGSKAKTPSTPKPTEDPELIALKEKLRVFEETLHREREQNKERNKEEEKQKAIQDKTNLEAAACIKRTSDARLALEQKLKEEREASSALKLELEKVKSSLTETETRLKDAVEKNGSANSKYLQDLLNKASDNYAELYGRLDQSVQEHAKEVERLRSEHTQELQRREKEWAAERERLQKQVEEKDSRISALEEEVEQVMEETYDEAMVLQKRISGLKDECDALDLEVEERDNEIQRLTEELASGGGRKKRKRTTTPGPRTGSGAAAKVSKSELDGLLRPAAKLLDIPVPAEKVEEEVDDVDGEEEIDENGQSRRKKKKIVARIWISDLPTTTLPPRGRQASTRNRSYVHIPRKRRTGTQGP